MSQPGSPKKAKIEPVDIDLEINEVTRSFTLNELKNLEKRGQILRDLEIHKINCMLREKSRILEMFDAKFATTPIFLAARNWSGNQDPDRIIVIEANHRMAMLNSLDEISQKHRDLRVFCRMIFMDDWIFEQTWRVAGSLEVGERIERKNLPQEIVELALRNVAEQLMREEESAFSENERILAYLNYFDIRFDTFDLDFLRQDKRNRQNMFAKLCAEGFCSQEDARFDAITVWCANRESKSQLVKHLKAELKLPKSGNFLDFAMKASILNDAKTSELLEKLKFGVKFELIRRKLKKLCGKNLVDLKILKSLDEIEEEAIVICQENIIEFETINSKNLNIICIHPNLKNIDFSRISFEIGVGNFIDDHGTTRNALIFGPKIRKLSILSQGTVFNSLASFINSWMGFENRKLSASFPIFCLEDSRKLVISLGIFEED